MTNYGKQDKKTAYGSAGVISLSGIIQPLHVMRQQWFINALMATPADYLTEEKRLLTNAYLSIDRNGNISYLVREQRSREDKGILVCYIDTPCGRRIRAPKRLDTEALMSGGK